jgi:hypothetical protein
VGRREPSPTSAAAPPSCAGGAAPTSPAATPRSPPTSPGRRTLILDGELTAFDGERPSFALLQRRLHVTRPAPSLVAAVPVTFIAFDLLWQASRSLLRSPYAQRRALLDGLGLAAEHLSVPPAFPGQARALADASLGLGLEGVVLICSAGAFKLVTALQEAEARQARRGGPDCHRPRWRRHTAAHSPPSAGRTGGRPHPHRAPRLSASTSPPWRRHIACTADGFG